MAGTETAAGVLGADIVAVADAEDLIGSCDTVMDRLSA
jgi:hypothetical protein